jgi:hypothetical protein
MAKSKNGEFRLHVPLDASGVKDFKPDRTVKAVAFDARGHVKEETVKFDKDGKGKASFTISETPGRLRVVVGPPNASAEQLKGLQTIAVDVSAGQWAGKNELTLTPIPISAYYWWWWFWWCRDFKITGRVVCADGISPVPGATVCAYDVDWWWWWWSKDSVGCATTDVNGAFEIDFVRCCGWWPWWWWEQRVWLLEPNLVSRISAILQQAAKLPRLPLPSPQPDLGIFQQLLASPPTGAPRPQPASLSTKGSRAALRSAVDPAALDSLRRRLLEVLPPAPELEQLELWPWWPWWPWWDCDADIIFNVTQNCSGQTVTIVNETVSEAHWNIPNQFNVTLTANDQACCIAQCTDCPPGDCILVSDFCGDNVGSIGGNYGAIAASPVGLLNPGEGGTLGDGADRPYAGTVPIYGYFGDLAQPDADYYELLFYSPGLGKPSSPQPVMPSSPLPSPPFPSSDYAPLPVPAFGGFDRSVFVAGPPPSWPAVPFPVQTISDGSQNHYVIETISHYEANNGPQLWDAYTYNLLAELNTLNNLSNGTYYLQIRSWTRTGYVGNLSNPQILSICGTEESKNPIPNYVVITIDNQVVTSGPNDPYGLPCAGTVHQCTVQPETAILQVQILHQDGTTTNIGPCDNVCIVSTDQLVIDFVAYDPDAYLAYYTLQVTYGPSLFVDLLAAAGPGGLSASPIPPPWTVAAAQVGPDYGTALTQGASSPWWSGGAIRLTMNAGLAFPETCAYELQLYAHKRTIGSCDGSFWSQYNLSELSFTIVNPCPTPILSLASEVKKA